MARTSSNEDGVRTILRESVQRAEVILAKRSSRAGQNLRQVVDEVDMALASEDISEERLLKLLAETEAQVQLLSAPLDAKALAMELQELSRLVGRLDPRVEEDLASCRALREHLEMELSCPGDDIYKKLARDLERVTENMDKKLRDSFEVPQAPVQNRSIGAQLQGIMAGTQKPANDSKDSLVLPKLVVGEDGEMATSSSQECVCRALSSESTDLDAETAEMRAEQTSQILKDMQNLKQIQQTIAEVTEEQSENLGLIEDNVSGMRENTANGGHEVANAARSKSRSWTIKGGLGTSAVGAVVGLACGGPVGAAIGAAAGGGVGGLSGKFLKKKYRQGVDSAEAALQGGQK